MVAALDLVPFKSGVAHPEGLWGKTKDMVLRGHSRSLFEQHCLSWGGGEGGEGRGREVSLVDYPE